jgi:2-polyprenyl-3-methyl-5-hydroxy-6-metoxy-1,4-benzoquinol methylase
MMIRTLARKLARSSLFSRGKRLFELNCHEWSLPLSKIDKLLTGTYIILEDYSRGLFPPKFEDQAAAYAAEVAFRAGPPGLDFETMRKGELRKPFWPGRRTEQYLNRFIQLIRLLEQLKIYPPARLLELGCGTGWMSEFLAIKGFDVMGTDIAPQNIEDAKLRLQSVIVKDLNPKLRFEIAAMESVADTVGPEQNYDAVFVFAALHHAFDWRRAVKSSFACIRPGGWLLICDEPNVLHTFISYRVAKLSNTHEIGFSRGELARHLKQTGFVSVKFFGTPFHFWIKSHWIIAQKPHESDP